MSHLSAKGLTKIYSRRKVVNHIDLEISPGEVVGLLGPNGAGKTTTFYMIVGLIRPDGVKSTWMVKISADTRCINGREKA